MACSSCCKGAKTGSANADLNRYSNVPRSSRRDGIPFRTSGWDMDPPDVSGDMAPVRSSAGGGGGGRRLVSPPQGGPAGCVSLKAGGCEYRARPSNLDG